MNGFVLKILSGKGFSPWRFLAARGLGFVTHHEGQLVAGGLAVVAGVVAVAACPPARQGLARVVQRLSLRFAWRRAVRHAGVIGADDALPTPSKVRAIPAGHRMRVALPHGTDTEALSKVAEKVAASMGVREVRVARDAANAGVAWVRVVRRDPLAGAEPLPWPWLHRESVSAWEPVPIGVNEDGDEVALAMPGHNILAGGEPGGGKSGLVNTLVAAFALDRSVRLTLLDGKLVELAVWRRIAESCVGVSVSEAIDVLGVAQKEMDERYRFLLDAGKRKVSAGDGFGLHVLVVDELAHYLTGGDRKESAECASRMRDLVSRGRAAGVIVVAATQKPSSDIIPTSLRDLFGYRMSFRCSTPQASDTILGQGWASQGYSATGIDAAHRGVGLLLHEGGTPVRVRCFYLGDDDLSAVAARAEVLRRPAPPVAAVPEAQAEVELSAAVALDGAA